MTAVGVFCVTLHYEPQSDEQTAEKAASSRSGTQWYSADVDSILVLLSCRPWQPEVYVVGCVVVFFGRRHVYAKIATSDDLPDTPKC